MVFSVWLLKDEKWHAMINVLYRMSHSSPDLMINLFEHESHFIIIMPWLEIV